MIVAVANLKGGVGKSTITFNLACQLAADGASVVLVDADAQGTSAYWANNGVLPIRECRRLPLEPEDDAPRWINEVLSIEAAFVIIDCPPHLAAVTEAAIGISDLVLVPVTPSGADLVATVPALELIAKAQKVRQDGGPKCLLVPSKVDRRTSAGKEIEAALKALHQVVAPAVRQRTAQVDSFTARTWIGDYAPGSQAHDDIEQLAERVRGM